MTACRDSEREHESKKERERNVRGGGLRRHHSRLSRNIKNTRPSISDARFKPFFDPSPMVAYVTLLFLLVSHITGGKDLV